MLRTVSLLMCFLMASWMASSALGIGIIDDERILKRGDANGSDSIDATDGVYINNWLFNGGPTPPCLNQADVNNDGDVDITDSTYLFNWLFLGGPVPPFPGPNNSTCAQDDAPFPGCDEPLC